MVATSSLNLMYRVMSQWPRSGKSGRSSSNWKLHFKEIDTVFGEVKEYGMPKLYNLYRDQQERENAFFSDSWVGKVAFPLLEEHAHR